MSHIGLISLGRAQSTVRTQSVGHTSDGENPNPLGLTPAQLTQLNVLRSYLSSTHTGRLSPENMELIDRVTSFVGAAIVRQGGPRAEELAGLMCNLALEQSIRVVSPFNIDTIRTLPQRSHIAIYRMQLITCNAMGLTPAQSEVLLRSLSPYIPEQPGPPGQEPQEDGTYHVL